MSDQMGTFGRCFLGPLILGSMVARPVLAALPDHQGDDVEVVSQTASSSYHGQILHHKFGILYSFNAVGALRPAYA